MNDRTIMRLEDVPDEFPELLAAIRTVAANLGTIPNTACPHVLGPSSGLLILCLTDPADGVMCSACTTAHEAEHVPRCTICRCEITGEVWAFGVGETVSLRFDDLLQRKLARGERKQGRNVKQGLLDNWLAYVVFSVLLCPTCEGLLDSRRGFRDVTPA